MGTRVKAMSRERGILEDAAIDAEIAEALKPLARLLTIRLRASRAGATEIAPETIVGTRPPLPAPSLPGKTDEEARTSTRRIGPELLAYGWARGGGKSGRSAVWFGPQGGLNQHLADQRAKRRRAPELAATSSDGDDVDAWIQANGLRLTKRTA